MNMFVICQPFSIVEDDPFTLTFGNPAPPVPAGSGSSGSSGSGNGKCFGF